MTDPALPEQAEPAQIPSEPTNRKSGAAPGEEPADPAANQGCATPGAAERRAILDAVGGTVAKALRQPVEFVVFRIRVNITTSAHVEAYPDKKLLDKVIDWNGVDPKRLSSVAEVAEFKSWKAVNDPAMSKFAGLQDTCRQGHRR